MSDHKISSHPSANSSYLLSSQHDAVEQREEINFNNAVFKKEMKNERQVLEHVKSIPASKDVQVACDFTILYWSMVSIFWLTLVISGTYLIVNLSYFGIDKS